MGGSSVVNYLTSDPNSFRNSISNFVTYSKQCSEGEAISPNPKKVKQYVLDVKHELTYMQDETYNSLEEHAQVWLHMMLWLNLF